MALDADHRVMPSSVFPPDAERPGGDDAANLFAPISVENRITGNTRVHRQHVQAQLSPGSDYNYGREAYLPQTVAAPSHIVEEETVGYNRSVPPTFLHRTMRNTVMTSADLQRGDYPQGDVPISVAYAHAAAMQANAAKEASGGFGAPMPYQFNNRMDESRLSQPDGTAFGLGAQSAMQPYGYTSAAQTTPEAALTGNSYAPTSLPDAASQVADVDGYALPPVYTPTQAYASHGYAIPPTQPSPVSPVAPKGEYAPKRAGRRVERLLQSKAPIEPMMELPPMPVQTVDTWAAMGWKTPEPTRFENTAVWRVSDLTMFERNAFDEPLDPFRNPPQPGNPFEVSDPFGYEDGVNTGTQGMAIGAQTPLYPSTGIEQDAYPPYGAQGKNVYSAYPGMDTQSMAPVLPEDAYSYEDGYSDAQGLQAAYQPTGQYPPVKGNPTDNRLDTPKREKRAPQKSTPQKSAPQKSAPQKQGFNLSAMGPKRMVLFIGCTLAIIFCLVEVGKMVFSLMENEQDMQKNREDFYQNVGIDPSQPVNGVELLPAGQTYVPTATPVAAQTPTEAPRVDQNDPLIGVIDAGGASTTFQAALPSPTPATRTRLTQYPDNPLLSISADFVPRRQENADVVGQLMIDGVLDETFVQRNNTFYLTHNTRGVFGNLGAVFVDEGVVLTKPPENLLLRGQTTMEGRLFQPLLQYATAGKEFVESHGMITCNTIYENARYVIFAIIHADNAASSPDYFNYAGYPTFQSDAQMERYVQSARSRSVYPINVNVKASDRLLTLATISEGSDTSNLVFLCRMLRTGETDGNIQHD